MPIQVKSSSRVYKVAVNLDQTRNLKPTAEAFIAMCIWGKEYSEHGGGSMDFWDSLSPARKRQCKAVVDNVLKAKRSRDV